MTGIRPIPSANPSPVELIALGIEGGRECAGLELEAPCTCGDPAHHGQRSCRHCGRPGSAHYVPGACLAQAQRAADVLGQYGYAVTKKIA